MLKSLPPSSLRPFALAGLVFLAALHLLPEGDALQVYHGREPQSGQAFEFALGLDSPHAHALNRQMEAARENAVKQSNAYYATAWESEVAALYAQRDADRWLGNAGDARTRENTTDPTQAQANQPPKSTADVQPANFEVPASWVPQQHTPPDGSSLLAEDQQRWHQYWSERARLAGNRAKGMRHHPARIELLRGMQMGAIVPAPRPASSVLAACCLSIATFFVLQHLSLAPRRRIELRAEQRVYVPADWVSSTPRALVPNINRLGSHLLNAIVIGLSLGLWALL